jgi:hypothetical protein
VFCLGPPLGEGFTHKANIDALSVGCIPVVFYHASLDYPWHLPRLSAMRVLIPAADVIIGKVDVVSFLSKLPVDRVRAMQREIAQLRIAYPANVDALVEGMCMETAMFGCHSDTLSVPGGRRLQSRL